MDFKGRTSRTQKSKRVEHPHLVFVNGSSKKVTKSPIHGIVGAILFDGWSIATGNDLTRQPTAGTVAVGKQLHFIDGPTCG